MFLLAVVHAEQNNADFRAMSRTSRCSRNFPLIPLTFSATCSWSPATYRLPAIGFSFPHGRKPRKLRNTECLLCSRKPALFPRDVVSFQLFILLFFLAQSMMNCFFFTIHERRRMPRISSESVTNRLGHGLCLCRSRVFFFFFPPSLFRAWSDKWTMPS